MYFRWISSEHNPADGPSRGLFQAGVAAGTIAKAKAKLAKALAANAGTAPQAMEERNRIVAEKSSEMKLAQAQGH